METKFFAADEHPVVAEMSCSICLCLWSEPVEVRPCLHTFCRACLGQLTTCPDCRTAVGELAKPSRILMNMLHVLEGNCSRCGWRGTHGEFESHHKSSACTLTIQTGANGGAALSRQATEADDEGTDAGADTTGDNGRGGGGGGGGSARMMRRESSFTGMGPQESPVCVGADGVPNSTLFPTIAEDWEGHHDDDGEGAATTGGDGDGGDDVDVERLPLLPQTTTTTHSATSARSSSTAVGATTVSQPWVEYNLSHALYENIQLAFFAFADVVLASEAPYPDLAPSDHTAPMDQRFLLLLRPGAVKRCLWWLNFCNLSPELIIDELFPMFGIDLPSQLGQAELINHAGALPRPVSGSVARDGSPQIVYAVTLQQLLLWLSGYADRLSPPVERYGLTTAQYGDMLEFCRLHDAQQTGAFGEANIEPLYVKYNELLGNLCCGASQVPPSSSSTSKQPASTTIGKSDYGGTTATSSKERTSEVVAKQVLPRLAKRRDAAVQAYGRLTRSRQALLGVPYPPQEYLLDDILATFADVADGEWQDAATELLPPAGVPPLANTAAKTTTTTTAASSSQPSQRQSQPQPQPQQREGFLSRLFRRRQTATPSTHTNKLSAPTEAAAPVFQSTARPALPAAAPILQERVRPYDERATPKQRVQPPSHPNQQRPLPVSSGLMRAPAFSQPGPLLPQPYAAQQQSSGNGAGPSPYQPNPPPSTYHYSYNNYASPHHSHHHSHQHGPQTQPYNAPPQPYYQHQHQQHYQMPAYGTGQHHQHHQHHHHQQPHQPSYPPQQSSSCRGGGGVVTGRVVEAIPGPFGDIPQNYRPRY